MNRKRIKRIALWLLVIFIAGAIFYFSAMNGPESMELSDGLTNEVVHVVHPDFDELPPAKQKTIFAQFVVIVRKSAHFSEFAALGASLMLLIHEYRLRKGPLWAWGIGTLYAGTDELHQYFIGTRTPTLQDVAIDSSGVLIGVLTMIWVIYLITWIKRKKEIKTNN